MKKNGIWKREDLASEYPNVECIQQRNTCCTKVDCSDVPSLTRYPESVQTSIIALDNGSLFIVSTVTAIPHTQALRVR